MSLRRAKGVDEQTECAECARLTEMCRRIAEVKQAVIVHLEKENKRLRDTLEKLTGVRPR